LALLVGSPSCYLFNPNKDPPAEVEHCHLEGIDGTTSEVRGVALGEGRGSGFVPYEDGGTATYVTGGQGLTMITPVVRVEAKSGDPSETCLLVRVLSENAGGAGGNAGGSGGGAGGSGGTSGSGASGGSSEGFQLTLGAKMKLEDGYLYTDGVLYNPVEWDRVRLTLTVTGPDFEGTSTVTVVHP